jgi:hypothetical protein
MVAMLLTAVLVASAPAKAVDELTGITVEFAPSEIKEGEAVHIIVTVHNSNTLPLNITGINIQANQGPIYKGIAQRISFNGSEGYVPAGGSAEIGLDGNVTGFIGTCRLLIVVGGFLGGSDNLSAGVFLSSTVIQPAEPPTIFGFDPLFLTIAIILVLVLAVLVVYLLMRRRT